LGKRESYMENAGWEWSEAVRLNTASKDLPDKPTKPGRLGPMFVCRYVCREGKLSSKLSSDTTCCYHSSLYSYKALSFQHTHAHTKPIWLSHQTGVSRGEKSKSNKEEQNQTHNTLFKTPMQPGCRRLLMKSADGRFGIIKEQKLAIFLYFVLFFPLCSFLLSFVCMVNPVYIFNFLYLRSLN